MRVVESSLKLIKIESEILSCPIVYCDLLLCWLAKIQKLFCQWMRS